MKLTKNIIAGASLLVAGVTSAFAQAAGSTTAAFTSSVTAVSADIATFGGALIGVAAVGVGFMVGMKYVKKIRGAA